MEKTDISVTTRKKLKKLVDKKYQLIDLADQVKEKKKDFVEEIEKLKKKGGNETEAKSLFQEFEENISRLLSKIKNIQI